MPPLPAARGLPRVRQAWFRRAALAVLCTTSAAASASIDFGDRDASAEVRQVAEWVNAVEDNDRLPFVLIDKVAARVYVFSRTGELQGNAAALLGSARGDATAAGIGSLPLSAIRPEHRTTPAGRFVAHLDTDLRGRNVLVIDHDASIALHPVVRGTRKERRAERLASKTPDDNRISFGCINVPLAFYNTVIRPAFTATAGIVYILPETRPPSDLFGGQAGAASAGQAE